MKKYLLNIFLSCIAVAGFTGCMKSPLLDQAPQTSISDANFWRTANDLKLYANNFYQLLPRYTGFFSMGIYSLDDNSDNMIYQNYNTFLNGEAIVPSSGGGWSSGDWANIRNVNHFLSNYSKVTDPFNTYSTYVGEAYFFRALFYFDKLQAFGAVPWINKSLTTNDSAYLDAARLPRNVIADSILADLDLAISSLAPKGQAEPMRIYKEYAQGFKSRVALFEGTWEKYHKEDPFGVAGQDGTKYLQAAAAAADAVINSAKFNLDNKGVANGYWKLFNQVDYSSSKEVMFWRKYNYEDLIINRWTSTSGSGAGRGITKELVDAYLATDGNPISVSPLYKGDDSLVDVVANRDPRLSQTIYTPGSIIYDAATYPGGALIFKYPAFDGTANTQNVTGYQLYKGHSTDYTMASNANNQNGITALIFMRYAEVLLNSAEAKAELSVITQEDLDKAVNLLRSRVNMPHLVLGSITTDPDWNFPALSPVINEVRRERRVELACEGFRYDDIFRWAAADELIVGWKPLGAKWNQWATVPAFQSLKINVSQAGYIEPFKKVASLVSGYKFNVNRDYLMPIPIQELTINPNLLPQNPGW